MASVSILTCLLQFEECAHIKHLKLISALPNNIKFIKVFDQYHGGNEKVLEFEVRGKQHGSKDSFDISPRFDHR